MTTETILAPVAALTIPDSVAMTGRAQAALKFIESFQIASAEDYSLAAEELQSIKRRANDIEAQRTGITGPINKALKAINDLFRGPAELLAQGEQMLKRKMIAWQDEQERIAAEVRRKAEAAAAAERQRRAEEAAAAQREAQAQAKALADAQVAQVAAAAAQAAAVAAGDKQAADEAQARMAEQQQAADLAHAAALRAQAESAAAATTSQMVTAVVSTVAPPKAAGVSTSTKLDFEVVDLLALVKHVAAHPELLPLVATDSVRLRAYVKGLGAACALPGVRVFESRVMSARAA